MKSSGDSTHHCQSPTVTVNGCNLTLPTWTQTSEQKCSDLTASSNRQPSTPYSRNTPQTCHKEPGRILSRGRQSMWRLLKHTPNISQNFAGE